MISLPIFTKNMNFFAWTFLNSSKIGRWKVFKNVGMQRAGKAKKREGGVFHRQNGYQKNCFDECYDICFLNICEKHPLIGENCIQSLKNIFYKYLTHFLDAVRWPNIWFLSSLSLSMIESNERCSKLFWNKMSMIDNRSFRPPQMYLEYLDTDEMRG